MRFYSSWFIHQVRNRSEMRETSLKTYKCSPEANEAGMVKTQSRMNSLTVCGCQMKKKPRKAAGNFLEGRAGLACLWAGLRAEVCIWLGCG